MIDVKDEEARRLPGALQSLLTVALTAAVLTFLLPATKSLGCDTEIIRRRIQESIVGQRLDILESRSGIVTFGLSSPSGGGAIVALHAQDTRLFTSFRSADIEEAELARVRDSVHAWNADPEFQRILADCGAGLPESDRTDPSALLRLAVDAATTRHARTLRNWLSLWSITGAVAILVLVMIVMPKPMRWRGVIIATMAIVVVPLAWMCTRSAGEEWFPTGDHALIELRTHDVGSIRTPLVGPYSQFWDHPGPLLFWLYAAPYHLFGKQSWALLVAAGIQNIFAVLGMLYIGWRRAGPTLTACLSLGVAVLIASLHADCVDPWNPWVSILPFSLVVVSSWSAGHGDVLALVLTLFAGSYVVQSHVAFAVPVGAMWLFALIAAFRCYDRRLWLGAGALLVVCWAPVLFDQVFGGGNLGSLMSYFLRGDRGIGWSAALGITARELSGAAPWLGYPEPGNEIAGIEAGRAMALLSSALVFVGAAVVAYRCDAHRALSLQAVVGLAILAGVFATSRIADRTAVWYLVRWWWVLAMFLWVSVLWSLLASIRFPAVQQGASLFIACVAVAVSLNTIREIDGLHGDASDQMTMAAITEPIRQALATAKTVVIESATPQAEGLLAGVALQLEKNGIRVSVTQGEERRFGNWRVDRNTAEAGVLVAAGNSQAQLRRAAARIVGDANLQLIASSGSHPSTAVAVFRFDPRLVSSGGEHGDQFQAPASR